MREQELTVADGVVVSLDYTLRLDSGEVVDTSAGREPLNFLQGAGQIIDGLEKALYGMTIGDAKLVTVAPGDGYGERDADAYQLVPLDAFPPDMDLIPGAGLQVRDQTGRVMTVYVTDVTPQGVVLDFNHPLAGETLHFDTKIAGLRAATAEELQHGHAH